jgi:hypothetical protein
MLDAIGLQNPGALPPSTERQRPLPGRTARAVPAAEPGGRHTLQAPLLTVHQDLPDHPRVLDAGDDPHPTPAALALLDLDC